MDMNVLGCGNKATLLFPTLNTLLEAVWPADWCWLHCAQVGVIHTSYRELSRRNSGILMAGISVVFNSLLCSIHCHKVALPALAG